MPKSFRANGTIRRARFVKVDTSDDHSILEADANERILGISQVGPRVAPTPEISDADRIVAAVATEQCMVHLPGETTQDTLLEAGSGGWTAGAYLKSDADGKGVLIDETAGNKEEVGARAMTSAAEGELGKVTVMILTVTTET